MSTQRNGLCPCGSGQKYKKCCFYNDNSYEREQKRPADITPIFGEMEQEIQKAYDAAMSALYEDDLAGAKKIADALLNRHPSDHRVLFLQGVCGIKGNNFPEAITFFKKAIEVFPHLPEAFYNLANLYKVTLQFSNAIRSYRRVIVLDTNGGALGKKATEELAALEQMIRDNDNLSLDEYIQSEESYHQAYNYLMNKQYEMAIASFHKTVQVNTKHAPSYDYLAMAYCALGKNQKALAMLDKALSIDPNHAHALSNRRIISQLQEGQKFEIPLTTGRKYKKLDRENSPSF